MTDTGPPTPVDDIVVRGQRRRSDGSFPTPFMGGGGGGDGGGSPALEDELDTGEGGPFTSGHPCASTETALDWNADAAAAEALRLMEADAPNGLPDPIERSFVIARDPATGRVYLGQMGRGVPFSGEVDFDMTGIDPAHVIGLMHTHPGSGPYPSGPDRTIVFPFFQNEIAQAGGDPSLLRLYMVGGRQENGVTRTQVRVYDETNLDGNEENPGPEVNPDAQYCPG